MLVRILLVPLAVKQIRSMQEPAAFAPQMKEIQPKYKHDKQEPERGADERSREHKINPAASCLPLVAQIPVFIALYLALKHLLQGCR